VAPAVRIGLSSRLENHQITDIQDPTGTESDLLQANIIGAQGGFYSGIGAEFILDRRDNIDWPSQGQLASLQWDIFTSTLGSDQDFDIIKLEAAQYLSMTNSIVALHGQFSLASEDTPFTHLPRPSGDSTLRGVDGNRWIDNIGLGLQSELRKPLSNKWAVVGFIDSFQVAEELESINLSQFHYSFGGGIRYAVTPDRFNIRFDLGYVDLDSINFAFSVGEAF
jgi:outer membrane protein assembly factor BamA